MAKLQEKYELMFILNPALGVDGIEATVEKFKTLIKDGGGELEAAQEIGKRRLAYEINYISEGYYVLFHFAAPPELPKELDRVMGITDGIIRRLITVRPEGAKLVPMPEPKPAPSQAEKVAETADAAEPTSVEGTADVTEAAADAAVEVSADTEESPATTSELVTEVPGGDAE